MADGTRTHDDQNHNLGLYQLSYSHHWKGSIIRPPPSVARVTDPQKRHSHPAGAARP